MKSNKQEPIDGLVMASMLPEFNVWHKTDGENAQLTVDDVSLAAMITEMRNSGMPTAFVREIVESAARNAAGGTRAERASDVLKTINSVVDAHEASGVRMQTPSKRKVAATVENIIVPMPPIQYLFRHSTDWPNAAYRTGSSCWWSSNYKSNFTPGEYPAGGRTGFAIMLAMDGSRVKANHRKNWNSAKSRGRSDLYPEGWGPLGRAWIYPADNGLFLINIYDDFRDQNEKFTIYTIAQFVASILNQHNGTTKFTASQLGNMESAPLDYVHVNGGRASQVYVEGAPTPHDYRKSQKNYRVRMWPNTSWSTLGNRTMALTDDPMIYGWEERAPVFIPLYGGEEYVVSSKEYGDYITKRVPDAVVEVKRSTDLRFNVMPKCFFPDNMDDLIARCKAALSHMSRSDYTTCYGQSAVEVFRESGFDVPLTTLGTNAREIIGAFIPAYGQPILAATRITLLMSTATSISHIIRTDDRGRALSSAGFGRTRAYFNVAKLAAQIFEHWVTSMENLANDKKAEQEAKAAEKAAAAARAAAARAAADKPKTAKTTRKKSTKSTAK